MSDEFGSPESTFALPAATDILRRLGQTPQDEHADRTYLQAAAKDGRLYVSEREALTRLGWLTEASV